MRFRSIHIEQFKAIASASIEFAPGLNVLYGPNDLGKSTVGQALRAALLLPATSAEARDYQPWSDLEANPSVTVVLEDDDSRVWKIEKRFKTQDAALWRSKNGRDFASEASDRQVDEKIRALLRWGVPTPGGKGGPRGMPESYLAKALLSGQTEVESILSQSLADDPDPYGRVRLTEALATLAQDPLVRHVMQVAQREYEAYFTASGKKRGGANSKLARASAEVKQLTAEVEQRRQVLASAQSAKAEVDRLVTAWQEAELTHQRALEALEQARASNARAVHREALARKVDDARELLNVAMAHEQRQADAIAARRKADAALEQAQLAFEKAQATRSAADTEARAADEALREVRSAAGASALAAERAQVEAQIATVRLSVREKSTLIEQLKTAHRSRELFASAQRECQRLEVEATQAQAKVNDATSDVALAEGVRACAEWRAAARALEHAKGLRDEAARVRTQALEKTAEALRLNTTAKQDEADYTSRRAQLPSDDELIAFEKVRHSLALAEASLGGGVTVALRPTGPVMLKAVVDDAVVVPGELVKTEHTFDAERRLVLSVGQMFDLEVIAGAPEKRKDAEHLRRRWRDEVLARLEACGMRSLEEVGPRLKKLDELKTHSVRRQAEAAKLSDEAAQWRERSKMLDERAKDAPSEADVAARRARVTLPIEQVEPIIDAMGEEWDRESRLTIDRARAALNAATERSQKANGALELARARLADAQEAQTQAPEGDSASLENEVKTLAASLSSLEERQRSLESASTGQVELASKRAEAAAKAARAASELVERTETALREAHTHCSTAIARLEVARAELAKHPTAAAQLGVTAAERELHALPGPFASADDVSKATLAEQQARAAAVATSRDAAAAEGALSTQSRPQALEQLRAYEEALEVARASEKELELDGAAWRLLVETIKEAEKHDASSLGKALAQPVSRRFQELTHGRYGTIDFDANLKTLGVNQDGLRVGPAEVLRGLSVGTRDHLATLIRLAIAMQLKAPVLLDDHLVHSDDAKLEWFRDALAEASKHTQVIVLTCQREAYAYASSVDLTTLIRRR